MKRIMSKKDFITGIAAFILGIICVGFKFTNGANDKISAAAAVLFIWSIYSFITAFTKKGTIESSEKYLDERDKLIVMKSGHMSLTIINYICWGAFIAAMLLFGILKQQVCLIVGYTLGAVILMLLAVSLIVNCYYERRL